MLQARVPRIRCQESCGRITCGPWTSGLPPSMKERAAKILGHLDVSEVGPPEGVDLIRAEMKKSPIICLQKRRDGSQAEEVHVTGPAGQGVLGVFHKQGFDHLSL